MDALIKLAEQFGPWVAFVALFVWQTVIREKRMTDRLDKVQDEFTKCRREVIERATETNTRLITVVESNTAALTKNTDALIRIDRAGTGVRH